jgi:hypothetical protein
MPIAGMMFRIDLPFAVSGRNIANDRVANDRVANDRVANDRVANDRVANDREQRGAAGLDCHISEADELDIGRNKLVCLIA